MNIPGFTAAASLSGPAPNYRARSGAWPSASSVATPQATAGLALGGLGGFGPTLPSCHWEQQWVVCGSALPGYPVPMCLEWVYVCKFPGSSRSVMM